jgi:multiple sugar transport system substrate-binding protein
MTSPNPTPRRSSKGRAMALSAMALAASLTLAACGSSSSSKSASGTSGGSSSSSGTSSPFGVVNKKPITMLFGSSGTPETDAEKAAGAAFTKKTGIPVKIVPASNLDQQLAQDFSANTPPNLFYLDPTDMRTYAKEGALDEYAYKLPDASDFYSGLASAFVYDSKLVCAPKDGSTLNLYINDADWKAAGLTSANYPKNWSELASVAKRLTGDGRYGMVVDPSESRLDAFLYQAGGSVLNSAGTKVTLDSPQNIKALAFVKSMLDDKTLVYPSSIDESDEIPAFGANKAAMVLTGPWMQGEMQQDYPKVKYTILPLPAGPTGTKATLSFTNCWGVPKVNDNPGGTVEFVEYLTSEAQELRFSQAFGSLPSLKSAQAAYEKKYPADAEQLTATAFAHPDISIAGDTNALAAFNSALAELATQSPATILSQAQTNLQDVLSQDLSK